MIAGPMPATVIETYELTRRFGDIIAVASVTFTVNAGEIFGRMHELPMTPAAVLVALGRVPSRN